MSDRVRPPQELEVSVLDRLKDAGIFSTKQKGIMFAAALGYKLRGGNIPDGELGKMGEGIRLEYFQKVRDEGFINALAVAVTNDLAVLSDERHDERLEIFEKYAAVGLAEMRTRLVNVPLPPLDALTALLEQLNEPQNASGELLPGLSSLI